MSAIKKTSEADKLVPWMVSMLAPPSALRDPGRCRKCEGHGRYKRFAGHYAQCEVCRGNGWPQGRWPFGRPA